MKYKVSILLLIFSQFIKGQIFSNYIDTNDSNIKKAVVFYKQYVLEFENGSIDYKNYWSKKDYEKYETPDPIVYSISSDYPTYNFGIQKTIFYARAFSNYVHLKTLMTQTDSFNNISVYAITNHYISTNNEENKLYFINPMEVNSQLYTSKTNGNITYHFLKTHPFDKNKSDQLIASLKKFESDWGFNPIKIDYFFTDTPDQLGTMRGLDYYYGMEQIFPSGMAFPKDKIIYCNGSGENNFHEILHLYLNPLYEKSPINHGLIYYLGGSLGHNFNFLISKMNEYLIKYPNTDLSEFETLETKDITLHINHTVIGLICKIIDKKEGVNGLKRLLTYDNMEILFKKEFNLQKKDWHHFLKEEFKKQDTSKL
ncbi:conserved hypothetical protein [Flavobacterium sp. 9AF]|uniref:hypothetical protein n=1 Tax=Flavobacterium sp. 9AF TaxID=2653142 RepID=UPI0012F1EF97|nr:hypothetical protein [Flavobacterium sp. 9AF]VXB60099.1 conserved hypothetical protein [Flavobacterium sp. 9AF]